MVAKTLLSVGTNHSLLGIRNLVLARAGYKVLVGKSAAGALQAIESGRLDAVVVGHSVSRRLTEQIVAAARLRRIPTVVLHLNAYEARVTAADANLCGIDGAARIVEVLTQLLPSEMGTLRAPAPPTMPLPLLRAVDRQR
jgi:hypothetical protein